MVDLFRFQGKLRVGTQIFQDPKPHQTRISLSQVQNYNETNYGYVSNSLSVDSGSDGDVEDTPTTRTRTKNSYQYPGNFKGGIKFGGERCSKKEDIKTSSKQNTGRNRREERSHRKKLKFNFKKYRDGDRDKHPRKSCKVCPTCGHSWNGKFKKQESDTELSGDEMVCFSYFWKILDVFFQ